VKLWAAIAAPPATCYPFSYLHSDDDTETGP